MFKPPRGSGSARVLTSITARGKRQGSFVLIERINSTMKFSVVVFLSSLVGSSIAAPAIVWKNAREGSATVIHSSNSVHVAEVIADAVGSSESLAAIFLVNRGSDGSESLTELSSNGSLPGVASKYGEASTFHHNCGGVESPHAISRMANSLTVSLSEFSSILTNPNPMEDAVVVDENGFMTKAAKEGSQRAKALATAKVFIINVPAESNPYDLDSCVVKAIESDKVSSVVLTGIRSTTEVKHERGIASRRRVEEQMAAGRTMSLSGENRRLQQNDDANGGNNNMNGVYYVNMTPNIFAGIMFGLLFSFIAWTGINCMGMISGQEVFVSKMPTVGREA